VSQTALFEPLLSEEACDAENEILRPAQHDKSDCFEERSLCPLLYCASKEKLRAKVRGRERAAWCGNARVPARWRGGQGDFAQSATPHNMRIKPTASGSGPRVSPCLRAWCCGVQWLAKDSGGLAARRLVD